MNQNERRRCGFQRLPTLQYGLIAMRIFHVHLPWKYLSFRAKRGISPWPFLGGPLDAGQHSSLRSE